ncbi:MAG TPA: N,N-dimethylformamidase beta subunit family domain-containing protein, partial [Bacteroidia bacterium]|nr:N,N-dimethylformamidase beta subunit family domain-containing protein [Bacteroidia bacterium]
GYIRIPGIQKSSLPTTLEQKEKSALNSQNTSAKTQNNIDNISQFEKGPRIALIEPTFTAAAYNNSFYVFYQKYSHVSADNNITNDLNLLSSKVIKYPTITPTTNVHSAFAMLSLLKNFKLISPDSNITVLTDADVDNGSVFHNSGGSVDTNSNVYDVVILGHQEYVTQREYNYLKDFVSNGGTMFLLDGNQPNW